VREAAIAPNPAAKWEHVWWSRSTTRCPTNRRSRMRPLVGVDGLFGRVVHSCPGTPTRTPSVRTTHLLSPLLFAALLVVGGSGCSSDCTAIGYLDRTTITIPAELPRAGVTFTICIDDGCSVSPNVEVNGNTVVSTLRIPPDGEVAVTFTASTNPPAKATLKVRPRSINHGCSNVSRSINLTYDAATNTLHKP
jgi:hypothetical protein